MEFLDWEFLDWKFLFERFTVAGQRRIFTELPPPEELLSCRRTKPQGVGVGN